MAGPVIPFLQNFHCCSWIQHQISSAKETLFGLCSTDCKVYTLLILGRGLQAAAVTGLLTSITFAFVVGPVALCGLIASVALGVLGTCITESKEQIREMIEIANPFVPGQPVGLSNSGGNCWLNSGLQMLDHIPCLARRMRQIPGFVAFLTSYRAACQGSYKIAPDIDTHLLRQILNRETGGQVAQGHSQEDAALLFECLFQGSHSLHTFDHQLNGLPAAVRNEPLMQLNLREGSALLSFDRSLSLFFDHPTDMGQRQQLFVQRAPNDLLIQFNRFYRDPDGTSGKINDSIDVPIRLQFPSRFIRTGENSNYECDSFLCHHGIGLNGGHYVSYIKKEGGWWYCSDSCVMKVSTEQAVSAMKQSYIVHYSKI